MKKEVRIFLTAIMFLTRIRVPPTVDHSHVYLQAAPRYFPVVGWIVGAISALFYLLGARFISADVGVIAAMIAGILVTGAFHEDGFADVCDGFGGGWTKEKILEIMKDSRIGAYGAIGLIVLLGSKFILLKELPSDHRYVILAILCAHSLSRLMPVLVMQMSTYAGIAHRSKSGAMTGQRLTAAGLVAAIVFALAPFAFLSWHFLLMIAPVLYATFELSRYFKRWIGGYTGDCLGAIQQVSEILVYLGFVVIFRYF
jgi:adenosylcobinamide-GDP ribazoletransferase